MKHPPKTTPRYYGCIGACWVVGVGGGPSEGEPYPQQPYEDRKLDIDLDSQR